MIINITYISNEMQQEIVALSHQNNSQDLFTKELFTIWSVGWEPQLVQELESGGSRETVTTL